MKLSVIIPVYHEPIETIDRAINSITNQHKYSTEDVEIIIALDDPERTLELPGVKVVKTVVNTGPGVARQRGIDASTGDYITFLDADDIWYNALALDLIFKDLKQEPDYIKFPILEENDDGFIPVDMDSTWCFSKVFKRSFLEEHHISFDPVYRVHEDSWFVRSFELYEPKTIEHGDMIYLWTNNKESTVRRNDGVYWQTSFPTYIDVVYRLAEKKGTAKIDNRADHIYNFCYAYANICRMDPEYEKESIAALRKHVDADEISMVRMFGSDVIAYMRQIEQLKNMPAVLPKYSFDEFCRKVIEK